MPKTRKIDKPTAFNHAIAIKRKKRSFRSLSSWRALSFGYKSSLRMVCGTMGIFASLALAAPAHADANSEIGIAKEVSTAPALQPDGTFTLQYTIRVTNPNSFDVEDVQVTDDLSSVFAAPANIISATVSSSDFTASHSSVSDTSLLAGTDTLAAGATGTITIDVVMNAAGETGPYSNTADAEGESACVVAEGTTTGLAIDYWEADDGNGSRTSVPLSLHWTGPLDANGFRSRTDAPDETGFSTQALNITDHGSTSLSDGEIARGDGWVSAPCVNGGGTSWQLRFRVGGSIGTYLGAIRSDNMPTSANILSSGGIEGQQVSSTTNTQIFTGAFGTPAGITVQIDDRGSASSMRLQERINGGGWTTVPLSRLWAEKPTGAEIGGRAVSDTSDNGDNPDPTETNGVGGVDDPTPVSFPLVTDLSITKTNTLGVNGEVDQASDTVTSGTTTSYTLVATNNGPSSITGAIVTDTPTAGITCPASNAVTITGNGQPTGSFTFNDLTNGGITLGTLADGQSTTLTYSCDVN